MKAKLFISLTWVAGSFLLLTWLLYAVNDYDRSMLAAVTGEPGVKPTLDRAKAMEAQMRDAKTLEERSALQDKIAIEQVRYLNAGSASVSLRLMIERAWILWGVSAFVPLLFIWWSHIACLWRRSQRVSPTQKMHEIRDETNAV